jgi:hypothetical protein
MRRLVLVLVLVLIGCSDSTGPVTLSGSYALRFINGAPLPAGLPEFPDGSRIEFGALTFAAAGRPRALPRTGFVTRVLWIRRPDQSLVVDSGPLRYSIEAGILHIDLCPINAMCTTSAELVGPVEPSELVLTARSLASQGGSVYRYQVELPD